LNDFAIGLLLRGEDRRAEEMFEEVLALDRALGITLDAVYPLSNLGVIAQRRGEFGRAITLFRESLSLASEQGQARAIANDLGGLAAVAVACGQEERAARLFGAAEALREAIAVPLVPMFLEDYQRVVATAREGLTRLGSKRPGPKGGRYHSSDQSRKPARLR
jgi:hypothetical protein